MEEWDDEFFESLVKKEDVEAVTKRCFLKNGPWHRYFLVNFGKFLKTPFFTEHLWWLLLKM